VNEELLHRCAILREAADAIIRKAGGVDKVSEDDAALCMSLRGAAFDLEVGRPVKNVDQIHAAARLLLALLGGES
jgi:hypothetical protein